MENENKKSEIWPITRLKGWEKNPRTIAPGHAERLVEQVKKLGQYKPLLVTETGIVLGGNMRLEAYKKLGITNVWVSIVSPQSEKEMLEYALSDNDRAGEYNMAELKSLVERTGIDQGLFAIDSGKQITLESLPQLELAEGEMELPSNDKAGFQQMTFILSDNQAEEVRQALNKVQEQMRKEMGTEKEENENSNGNALAIMARAFFVSGITKIE